MRRSLFLAITGLVFSGLLATAAHAQPSRIYVSPSAPGRFLILPSSEEYAAGAMDHFIDEDAPITDRGTVAPVPALALTPAVARALREICAATVESHDPRFFFDYFTHACAPGTEVGNEYHPGDNTDRVTVWLLYNLNSDCLGVARTLFTHTTSRVDGSRATKYLNLDGHSIAGGPCADFHPYVPVAEAPVIPTPVPTVEYCFTGPDDAYVCVVNGQAFFRVRP